MTKSTVTNERGVLMIARSHAKYARQAVNLARSIRLRDLRLPLAVATDLSADLFENMFDAVIPWQFDEDAGLLCKLDAWRMSPYERTIFLDTDMLIFTSLEAVFTRFDAEYFGIFGKQVTESTYFESMGPIRAALPAETYPKFNSGLYYFLRGEMTERLFTDARRWCARYDDLQICRQRGMESDEPLLSVAMTQAGLAATDPNLGGVLMNPIWPDNARVSVDVIAGDCIETDLSTGRRQRRGVLHYYGGGVLSYGYAREATRMAAAFRNPNRVVHGDRWIRLRELAAWAATPQRWRWRVRRAVMG